MTRLIWIIMFVVFVTGFVWCLCTMIQRWDAVWGVLMLLNAKCADSCASELVGRR